jgi:putative two-component system response regulator
MLKRIENHLRTAEYERGIEAMVSQRTSQILKLQDATISVFAKVVESRDKNTGEHIQRTRDYFLLLLSTMKKKGLMLEEIASWGGVDALSLSVLLHDLGKIIVPDAILNKPGKLTDEEFDQIKLHTTEGERIITELATRSGNEMFFENAKIFAGTHHEKWNGSGYPRGTTGTKIPLQGRMLAIADVYDALVSKRPYKSAMTHEAAVKIIKESSGTHFDPQLVQVFLEVAGGFEMISQTY